MLVGALVPCLPVSAPFIFLRKLLCVFLTTLLRCFLLWEVLNLLLVEPSFSALTLNLTFVSFVAFIYILRASLHFCTICSQKDTK